MSPASNVVTIVGAGIAGAACAAVLREAGRPFRLVERSRAPGGRMASPELHARRVDIGAGYFTVRDPEFTSVVARWESAGLARPWTDTFGVIASDKGTEGNAVVETSTGPMRWATPNGLRSLVRSILTEVQIEAGDVTQLPDGDVVLAMPDPQAGRLTTVPDAVDYEPVVTVVCGFDSLSLPFRDAAFVNGHRVLEFVANDGSRRGDGAAVLVVHTTPTFARSHLEDPDAAVPTVIASLQSLLDIPDPRWTHAHRWTFGKPAGHHESSFHLAESRTGRTGFAGDQWCPTGSPRIESAWRSGTDLGRALLRPS